MSILNKVQNHEQTTAFKNLAALTVRNVTDILQFSNQKVIKSKGQTNKPPSKRLGFA